MKSVVKICISVIQIRTWVKKFSVYIIQIKISVESIQIRNKFIQFSMHFTYVCLYMY